jgi:aspartyl aminopeptidase
MACRKGAREGVSLNGYSKQEPLQEKGDRMTASTDSQSEEAKEAKMPEQAAMHATPEELAVSRELIDFIQASPSMFHTVATARRYLDRAGFTYLPEAAEWRLERGGRYYTTRNGSSVIAFSVGNELDEYHFQMAAAHADSPTFKVKSVPELEGPGEYLRLDVEAYGGMIDWSWLDRPLSLAGRVLVQRPGAETRSSDGAGVGNGERDGGDACEALDVESRLFAIDKDVLLIPSVAIHFNRSVNDGYKFNRQVDLCPLFSAGQLKRGDFDRMIASELGIAPEQILGRDLFLVNRTHPAIWGWADEFVSTPKLDDLQCAFASLKAFLAADNPHSIAVWCCFDNEEVGSNTKQGAMSTLLADTLVRINGALGRSPDDYRRAVAGSFLVSCDNAHAVHPNHPELTDEANHARLNGGIVIKEAANQKYTTDAFSRALFSAICRRAGVPVQTFANRSDSAGGSTLGNLSNTQVSVHAVDVGLPQLAMHSSYETTGSRDTALGIAALTAYYNSRLHIEGAERVEIR